MLKLSNISLRVDAEPLFTGVSLVLNDGDRAGLVGPNGIGKTTLFRVITGDLQPESGSVSVGTRDRIALLPQEPPERSLTLGTYLRQALGPLHQIEREMQSLEDQMAHSPGPEMLRRYGELQGRFADLDGWNADWKVDAALERVGLESLPPERSLGQLSGGQLARAMMAAAVMRDPTVLLLDEPTNHLDLDGIRWLEDYVTRFAGVVMVISHDRRFLDHCTSSILELDGISPELQSYVGGYTAYREQKTQRWQRLLSDYEAQEKHRRRIEADIDRTRRQAMSVEQSTHNDHARRRAAKVARKAKSRQRNLARQMKLARWVATPESRPTLPIQFASASSHDRVILRLENVHARYGATEALRGVSLELRGGDRVALVGPNGSGKTTLLARAVEAIAGSSDDHVGYLPQDHSLLPLDERMLAYFRSQVMLDESDARTILDRFLFDEHQLSQPLRSLSSGERSRLVLAAIACSRATCLVLDEPTNHLDFDSLDVVEEALRSYRGSLLVVSHDRRFLANLGLTDVVAIVDGREQRALSARLKDELVPALERRA